MSLLRRLALMFVAFVASAAAVPPVFILLAAFVARTRLGWDLVEFAFIGFVLVAALAFFPALLVVAVAEWKRIRGWFYFTAAGGLIAFILLVLLGFMSGFERPGAETGPGLFASTSLFVGGLVAGFVYWLIAGRSSGALRDAWAARGIGR